jgi:multidrug efflux pump subunit AcrA (membrane-fusion protein)
MLLKKQKTLPVLWCLLAAVLALGALGVFVLAQPQGSDGTAQAADPSKGPITVVVKRVSPQDIREDVLLPGRVETPGSVLVVAEIDGFVTDCPAFLGAQVKKGSALCYLKSADPGFTSERVTVAAPVAGAVAERLVSPGSAVSKGMTIARVVPYGSARFVVDVPFAESSAIEPGVLGQLETLEGNPVVLSAIEPGSSDKSKGAGAGATIRCVAKSPTADPVTATIRTEWVPESVSASGFDAVQLARVRVVKETRTAIVVPQNAVRYQSNKPFVRIVKDGAVALVPVVLGKSDGETVEVSSGLATGDQVIVKASRFAKQGDPVVVEESPQAPRAEK